MEGRVERVGRERERSRLRDLVVAVAAGGTRAVVVEGEAGIGKTRLAIELADLAADRGLSVLWGAGDPIDGDRPFGPLVSALELERGTPDPERRELAGLLFGTVAAPGPTIAGHVADLRYRVVDGVTGLLERIAGRQPTALIVDDLQWADASTALALAAILRRVRDLPLLLVAATRPGPRPEAVDRAVEGLVAAGAEHLVLAPLRDEPTVELAASVLGRPLGRRLAELIRETGGNPLFALELVESLRDQGQLLDEGGRLELSANAAARDFGRRVLARVGRLGLDATLLVQAGAVLGTTFSLDEVAAVTGAPLVRLLPAVEEARRAGLLTDRSGALQFRHDLLRQVVYDGITPAARSALHREAGRTLASRDAASARVARHLVLGAEPGDGEAVRWLHQAARNAGPRAPHEALALLREASALAGPDHPGRLSLLAEQAEVLGWTGELSESEALARTVLAESADPEHRHAMHRQVSMCLFLRNRAGEAAEQADLLVQEQTDATARARGNGEAALAYMAAAQRGPAMARATAAIREGTAADDRISVCLAESVLSRYHAFDLEFVASLRRADAAVRTSRADLTGEVDRYQPAFFRLLTLLDLDRLDDAQTEVADARQRAMAVGASWALPLYHGVAAVTHLMRAELDDAGAEAAAGLVVVEEVGSPLAEIWLGAVGACAAIEQGRFEQAAALVGAAEAKLATNVPLLGLDLLLLAKGLVQEASGRVADACETLAGAWDLFAALGLCANFRIIGPALVRTALAAGDRERAVTTAEELARVAKATGLDHDEGVALLAAGMCSGDAGMLADAVDAHRRASRPLWLAQACETAGPAMWATGDRTDASALLGEAHELYERAGAHGGTRRVAQLCHDLGLRRARPRTRPTTGWGSLTDSERRVAALVVGGRTNQVIAEQLGISRRTVETHLSHAYAKLGIGSRVELALQAAQQS